MSSDWREKVRAHLETRIGEPIPFGELFIQFGHSIPLHSACRIANRRRRPETTSSHRMRWLTFVHFLPQLDITVSPPVSTHEKMTMRSTAMPRTRPCVVCENPFFGRRTRRICSNPECRRVFISQQAKAKRKVVRLDRYRKAA